MSKELSHIDEMGQVRMVDVGQKPPTERLAIAKGEIVMHSETLELIHKGLMKKGDVLRVARVAGIMAAKRTADLIPLCHPLAITHISLDLAIDQDLQGIKITSAVRTLDRTGVEMEALTSVAVAALTIYDMAKAVDKNMHIQNIRLVEKRGGQSGDVMNE